MNRREFILRSSTLVGLTLVPGCGSRSTTTTLSGGAISSLQTLARSLQGTLLLPGSPGFDSVSAPWNLRYAGQKPAAVARCLNAMDVQTCIQWSVINQVPLVARSGGHSYAGYSLTPGLMIDVSPIN